MSKISEHYLEALKENGYETFEAARKAAIKKLKKCNLSEKNLKRYELPEEELDYGEIEVIVDILCFHKDFPDAWCKQTGKDLSDEHNYMAMYMYIDY